MIKKDHICIDCQFKSQEETINGLIDLLGLPDHAKEAVKAREQIRPTCVPEGIAFPHYHFGDRNHVVAPQDKAYNSLIAIATFEQPIIWGNQPVRIVILLCSSIDFAEYIRSLAVMCKILHNKTTRDMVLDATSADEAFNIIRNDPSYVNKSLTHLKDGR
jgi:mannitol/fructose-specific phosphotransferase system IIA component (Ntr-type)